MGIIAGPGSLAEPPEKRFTTAREEHVKAAVSAELDHIWARVQAHLAGTVEEPTYRIWLEPLRPVELADDRLLVDAPARTCRWTNDRFGRLLQTCVAAVVGPEVIVELVSAGEQRAAGATADGEMQLGGSRRSGRGNRHARGEDGGAPQGGTLNPRLTFEQFVIGDSNRLAHAAALAVAEMPCQAYNPLFLYGPPGLGKTHLLHSIAAFLHAHGAGLAVRYTTGESFTNEFIGAMRVHSLEQFKARFRHLDVLLIDDVQFLERKVRTEEEFFHTINALSDNGSQLVVTSDRSPRDMNSLERRLRERFQAGLVVDVRPPDLATRLTILRKRVQHDDIALIDSGALDVIAQRVAQDIRGLEGALIRVVAFSSLSGRPLTSELASEVIDGLYPHVQGRAAQRSVAEIQAAACEQFEVSAQELLSPSRAARVTWPRQVAMYLARELTQESLPAIGRQFGGRDHTTVLHAWRRTTKRMAEDESARRAVDSLAGRLDRPGA